MFKINLKIIYRSLDIKEKFISSKTLQFMDLQKLSGLSSMLIVCLIET